MCGDCLVAAIPRQLGNRDRNRNDTTSFVSLSSSTRHACPFCGEAYACCVEMVGCFHVRLCRSDLVAVHHVFHLHAFISHLMGEEEAEEETSERRGEEASLPPSSLSLSSQSLCIGFGSTSNSSHPLLFRTSLTRCPPRSATCLPCTCAAIAVADAPLRACVCVCVLCMHVCPSS